MKPGVTHLLWSLNPTEPTYSKSDFESLAQISANLLADPELEQAGYLEIYSQFIGYFSVRHQVRLSRLPSGSE